MLVAVRPLFSVTSFSFVEDGKVVGEMERSLLRETAELDLDDGRYSFYRDQAIGGDYVIEHKGQTLARQRSRSGGGRISTSSCSSEVSSCEGRAS